MQDQLLLDESITLGPVVEVEAASPSEAYTRDYIIPLVDEFNAFRLGIADLYESTPTLMSGYQYSSIARELRKSVETAYSETISGIRRKAKALFSSEGIENIQLPSQPEYVGFEHDRNGMTFKCEDPVKHWEYLLSLRSELKDEGIRKFAKKLYDDLFGLAERRCHPSEVKRQKSAFVVTVTAWQDSYGWSKGYGSDSKDKIRSILEAIKYCALESGLDDLYMSNSCEKALGEDYESRNRVQFCDHCDIVTFSSSVKFYLSPALMEQLQIFMAENGFQASA